jgi:recombination protein RecR
MDPLQRCVAQLSRFPGIGERTATRLAYWLLRAPPAVAEEIASAIVELRRDIAECEQCCDLVTSSPCNRCLDPHREAGVICVVEQPQDIPAIERGGVFRGHYHVLHGSISPLDGVGPEQLRIGPLLKRIEAGELQEVILATDPDVEGDTTALYLARLLQPMGVRLTRLAHGIPVGTEIEYADKLSLARALQNRREM